MGIPGHVLGKSRPNEYGSLSHIHPSVVWGIHTDSGENMESKICLLLIHGNASRQSFLPFGYFLEAHSSSMSEPDKDLVHMSFLASLLASPLVCLQPQHLLDLTDRDIPVISLTTASLIPYPYYIVSLFF